MHTVSYDGCPNIFQVKFDLKSSTYLLDIWKFIRNCQLLQIFNHELAKVTKLSYCHKALSTRSKCETKTAETHWEVLGWSLYLHSSTVVKSPPALPSYSDQRGHHEPVQGEHERHQSGLEDVEDTWCLSLWGHGQASHGLVVANGD